MSDSFWFDNPNSLLDKEHITQIWPSKDLELGEKLNAVTRLVILPNESHGYRAKESILHLLWEQDQWLDKYVKNK